MAVEHTRLRPFQKSDLAPLVDFWNNAFADRRHFAPITTADFQERVVACEAFHPDGLILAWHTNQDKSSRLVGFVHAFRPTPKRDLYLRWEQRHHLALLYVDPAYRRQGNGTRLLRAAENWLYYCPVYAGGPAIPCYGTVEGPRQPFFGATQQLGISAHDSELIRFLAHRGYHVVEAGDVSMQLDLGTQVETRKEPPLPNVDAMGLRLVRFSHEQPFKGREPEGREEYTLYGDNGGDPYFGYAFVTPDQMLQAHISWYPMSRTARHEPTPHGPTRHEQSAAIAGFWVAPSLRGRSLGRYLLDRALYDLIHAPPPWGGYDRVEVQTHLVRHAKAAALYERRGFKTDAAWVNMSKECAVRGANPPGSHLEIQ